MTDNVQQQVVTPNVDRIYINRKKPIVTYTLIASCIVLFIIDYITGWMLFGELSRGYLTFYGMKWNEAISAGQVWRLLTSVFLHADISHIAFNMLALYVWGKYAEALYGRRNFLFIYLLAGLLGSLASYAFSDANALGASGAIYGVIGTIFYIYFYNRKFFQAHFGNRIFIIAAISLSYGFILPGIDNYAHVFGLLGGFLAAGIFGLIKQTHKKRTVPYLIAFIVIAIACGVIGYV